MFNISVTLQNIKISKEDQGLEFSPAEADRIKKLLSIALSLGDGAAGRPFIQDSPFRIIFNDQGKQLTLIKKGMQQGEGLSFTIVQTDKLIQTISTALQMFIDGQILRGGPANPITSRVGFEVPEPLIEGRD